MVMMSANEQQRFFATRLGRQLPRLQIDVFANDLLRMNLEVMDAALQKVAATAAVARAAPNDPRAAVHAEYDRRVAEIAQLFPLFFVFESAWRTLMASVLLAWYGSDGWWHPVRDVMLARGNLASIRTLGVQPARREVIEVVSRMLKPMAGAIQNAATSYELLQSGSLGNVEVLIDRHWSQTASMFDGQAQGGVPRSDEFRALFKRVRDARNDAYHHRMVAGRGKVIVAAERLLDLLNVHLESKVAAVSAVVPPPFVFEVARDARHR